jgi:hypothetical protein
MRTRYLLTAAVAAMFVGLMVAQAAMAGGPPVVNQTTVVKDFTQGPNHDSTPCTQAPAFTTLTGHATFHTTAFADGTLHIVSVINADFVVDAIDPAEEDFSGHVSATTIDEGTNPAPSNATSTVTEVSIGTHGTRLVAQFRFHFTVTPDLVVTVDFVEFTLRGCP